MRVRGRGFPGGDLFIEITTHVPTKLTDKQKKALKEFSGEITNEKKNRFF
jgi:DnaJ-class molecular chaperone